MKAGKSKADEVLYEIQHLFAGGWDSIFVGAFIKGVHDEINWAMTLKSEHFL
jgi:hypothetical protein